MASSGLRRLLLVSTNYAPEHAGIGPYSAQIAEHWAAEGAEVHVLTGMPHYPAWRLDPAYAGVPRAEEDRAGVRVHRRAHAVPGRHTAFSRARFEMSVLRGGRDEPVGMGRPDAVFAQMPSLAGGLIGARLARRHRVPFVAIVQDLMGAAARQSGIRGGGPASVVAGRAERYALRRAALVGVIHESFTEKVASMGVPRERIRVVPNWTHVERPSRPRAEMRARLGWRPGQTVLLHSGNMGLKQGLEVLVETARSAPETRVVLMGDGNQREQLRTLAGGMPNLDFLPPAPAEEFADVLAAADFLLVTQRASVRDMSLPSKLTSYFAAGRPILASVSADSGTAQEVVSSGAGVVVEPESAADLLAAVQELTADRTRAALLAAAGPVYVDTHLSRDAGLSRIDALLTEVLPTAEPKSRGAHRKPVAEEPGETVAGAGERGKAAAEPGDASVGAASEAGPAAPGKPAEAPAADPASEPEPEGTSQAASEPEAEAEATSASGPGSALASDAGTALSPGSAAESGSEPEVAAEPAAGAVAGAVPAAPVEPPLPAAPPEAASPDGVPSPAQPPADPEVPDAVAASRERGARRER